MIIDEKYRMTIEIFNPGAIEAFESVETDGKRFAYYTSADTAMKILQNRALWFRNATVMNDFSEISYGLDLLTRTFNGPVGKRFREAVDGIIPGTIEKAQKLLDIWIKDWQFETYLSCISLHDASEDKSGRLSMWRAYGDTAIVVKHGPMVAVTDLLAVYSLPVRYFSSEAYEVNLNDIIKSISNNRDFLAGLEQDEVVAAIKNMAFLTAIGTKHPGFKEEKEWRLYYRPNEQLSPVMKPMTVVIDGIPQVIYALPLKHDPSNGLVGADLPNLLDRIIIGPTEYPYVSIMAFRKVLTDIDVQDVENKVVASDIPLRAR